MIFGRAGLEQLGSSETVGLFYLKSPIKHAVQDIDLDVSA